jgi:hypothetical protein
MHGEAHAQPGAGEGRFGFVEDFAQCLGGACSVRGAERRQRDLQLTVGDVEVACGRTQLVQ